jgi:hypothetical protein
MKEEVMQDDHDRDAWLGPMLRQATQGASEDCVDADTLAAWSEGALDPRRTAEVERHASSCARCTTLLASMARTTPPPSEAGPERAWALGPMLRWLVPLTAAATAIAIWVAVPDGPAPSGVERPASSAVYEPVPNTVDERVPSPADGPVSSPSARRAQEAVDLPAPPAQLPPALPERAPETALGAPEPGTVRTAPQSAPEALMSREGAAARGVPQPARRDADASNQAREERQAADAFAPAVESLRDRALAPPPSSLPPAGPPLPTPGAAARSAPAAPATTAADSEPAAARFNQQTVARIVPTSESTSPGDARIQWRVLGWVSVERSIDGGNTWIKTTPPPGVVPNIPPTLWIVSVRAVDNLRAVVLMTDRREFSTTNGGVSWERVQENSAAPF